MPTEGWEGDIGNHDWGGFVSAQSPDPASGLLSQEASIRAAADAALSVRIDNFIERTTIAVGGDYVVTNRDADLEILVDASADNVTISLPPAIGEGQSIRVKKIDSTDNIVTVQADGTDLIDDSTSVALTDQWSDCELIDAASGYWDNTGSSGGDVVEGSVTSAELASLSVRVDNLSVAAASVSSAEISALVQIASAAATSANNHANAVSARVVSVSAELNSLLGSVEHRLSSRIDAVSTAGGGSVTSADVETRVQTASAAATAANTHANTVSARLVSASAELVSLINIVSAAIPPSTQTRLVSGGVVFWLETGFDYTVTPADYFINGVHYNSPATNFTLNPSDPSDDRIDVVAVDNTGSVVVLEGIPGGPPVEPQIDPATQLKLTLIYVTAGSTVPTVTNEDIYHENTEYTATSNSGNINVNSTNNPHTGSKDIEGTTAAAGNYVQLVKPSGTLDLSDYSTLAFYIRSKATWSNNKSISIFWMNGVSNVGVPVALKHGSFNFDSSNVSTYQLIAIPVSLFGIPSVATIDRLRMAVAGGGGSIGFYIDDIILQAGVIVGTGATKFTDLTDVPGNYVGQAGRTVKVKANELGLEFVSTAAAAASVTSAEISALIQIASAAATSADVHANTVSARIVSVSAELASLVQIASAAATSADSHANTASAAATSADGHANTVSARVVSVSAELASLVQIASAAATSADSHANTASAAATSADAHANTVSGRVVSVSAELASLVQIASAAATSADGHANTVSARLVSASAEITSLYTSVDNRLSTRIDSVSAGATGTHAVTLAVDGSGAVLTTGTKNPVKIPYGGTLTGWLLIGSPSGSITVDILRAADGAGLPVSSIVGGGGTKPSLSSAVENSSTSFTGWTSTTLTAKDNLAISLSGITTCTYVSLTLYFS